MALNTPSRSALHPVLAATTASADFSLRHSVSAFQPQGEISPGKNAHLHRTIAGSTPLRLDHESFAVLCPLALLGSAFYPILVHRLAVYAPRFLPTLGRPHAVALHFVRCDQLTAGLSPAGMRPCWAHKPKSQSSRLAFLWGYSVAAACSFSLLSQSVATASASAIPWAAVATFWGGRGEKSQPSYPYVRYIHRALPPAKPALLDVAPMLRCKSLLSFSFFSLFPFLLRARRAVRQEDCVNSATSRLSG